MSHVPYTNSHFSVKTTEEEEEEEEKKKQSWPNSVRITSLSPYTLSLQDTP